MKVALCKVPTGMGRNHDPRYLVHRTLSGMVRCSSHSVPVLVVCVLRSMILSSTARMVAKFLSVGLLSRSKDHGPVSCSMPDRSP
jgi:hypothetical protein